METASELKKLLNMVPALVCIAGKDGFFKYLNPEWEKVLGFSLEELTSQPLFDFIHPDDHQATQREIERQLHGERTINFKNRFCCKDGSYKLFEWRATPAEGEEFYAVAKDITESQKDKESLIKSESLFRGLYDNMTSGSAIYKVINDGSKGSDYIILNFNKKSLEIEGKTLEQVAGKSLFDLRPNIDNYGLIPAMRKVWETGVPGSFPVKIYEDKFFSNYYENYIFKIPTGEIVTIYNDVTNKKNADIALKESEERFALAMQFANDGLFDWNLTTNEIYYSPVWKRMLGYEDDELPNDFSTWEMLTHPDDVKRSWEIQTELINKKRDRFQIEFKMQHKDGHWVDILSRANAIFDENNNAVRIVGTHVDISERKKLENRLLQSQKLEAIGNLAGGIAHDFNNILSSILGFTELALQTAPRGSSQRDDLEEVCIAGNRAKDLVRQILAFARQSEEKTQPVRMSDIVTEVFKLLRPSTPTNIEIKPTINSTTKVMGNPSQLHQVVLNLCTNAIHSLEKSGGVLEIGLRDIVLANDFELETAGLAIGEYVELTVTDNGSGIDPTIVEKIFEPYFTTKGVGKGSGMGLAMVKGIAETYGGDIQVKSESREKTSFIIRLPVATERSFDLVDSEESVPCGTERILFVDDEPPIAQLGSRMLESLGYAVTTRTSSLEALELFKKKPDSFDLVITDMTMPSMTGDVLSMEIRRIKNDIPIILCTGYSNRINKDRAKQLGINGFAYKPFTKLDLSKIIREVLASNRSTSV